MTLAVILAVNNAAWLYFHSRTPSLNLLKVEQFEPAGGTFEAGARPTLTWRFNLDIADRDTASPPVTIRPALTGKFAWADARTLHFTPAEPLPTATAWDFTLLRDRLVSVEGCRLVDDDRRTCQTPSLALLSAEQVGFDERSVILDLVFNDLVLPADVESRLSITADGEPLRVRVRPGKPSKTITVTVSPITPAARTNPLQLTLKQGVAAHTGPLGLARDVTLAVPITSELALNSAEAGPYGYEGQQSIYLSFNGPIQTDQLMKVLSVEPAVPGLRCERNYDNRVILRGQFQPATRYALKIAPGEGDTPKAETRTLFVPDLPARVAFDTREGYLGAGGRRTVYAWAVNTPAVEVEIHRLYESNLVPWANTRSSRQDVTDAGRLVAKKTLRLKNRKNVREEIALKLDDLLPAEHRGDGVFEIRLRRADAGDDDYGWRYKTASMRLALSDIGLTVKQGSGQIVAAALSLATATPIEGTRIRVFTNKNQLIGQAVTAADGTAEIAIAPQPPGEGPAVVVADRGKAITWLKLESGALNLADFDTTGRPYLRTGHEAFVYHHRGVYRPGETVRFRAIVRGPGGAMPGTFPVQWVLSDPQGKTIEGATTMIDPDGATAWEWKTSDGTPTGPWRVYVRLPHSDRAIAEVRLGSSDLLIEDFLPDRLKVDLKLSADRIKAGGSLSAGVRADYLFGQPAAAQRADVYVTAQPAVFVHDAWKGWSFSDEANVTGKATNADMKRSLPSVELTLDGQGSASHAINLKQLLAGTESYRGAWRINVQAGVRDVSGRAVSRHASAWIDPAGDYIGLKSTALTGTPGSTAGFDIALVDPHGRLSPRDADLRATVYRVTWNNSMVYEDGRYRFVSTQVVKPVGTPHSLRATAGRARFAFTPADAGRYVVAIDDPGAGAVTSRAFDVIGRHWSDSISRENPEKLEVQVVPQRLSHMAALLDRADAFGPKLAAITRPMRDSLAAESRAGHTYHTGEWAAVVVRSPFPGTLLLTVETDRVITRRVIPMTESAVTVPVRIDDACRPNAYVSATVIRAIDPTVPWRTHRAYGLATLKVAEPQRKLNVEVAAPREIKPLHSLPVRVRVVDSTGRPVAGAAVTVAAVDEGILQLTDFATPNPFAFFTGKRALGVRPFDLYGSLVPDGARDQKSGAIGGDDEVRRARYKPPVGARRVKSVALASGVLHTDGEGLAVTDFPLPQFAGQLRVMAVASAGPASGSSHAATTVRSNLVVQTSWPRFAAPGDTFKVPVTVFNTSPDDAQATVKLALTGPAGCAQADPPAFPVPARSQQTHVFTVTAAAQAGMVRGVITASLAGESASEVTELPVRPASPQITRGDHLTAKPGEPLTITLPEPMLAGSGEYRLRVSPRPQLVLPQGLDYLNRYPYGCAEQTISTLMPLIALRDLGEQIDPRSFDPSSIDRKVHAGIARLQLMQRHNGALAMWPDAHEPWTYASLYAAHFVTLAEQAGYKVPRGFSERLFAFVRSVLNESTDEPDTLENQAYACYVLALAGRIEQADRIALERLTQVATRPALSPELSPHAPTRFYLSAAWLAIEHRTRADALIPGSLPAPRAGRQLSGNVGSPVSDRALILSTLLSVNPSHPALPGLAGDLAELGRTGQWRSTRDTALSLVALAQYQRLTKDLKPYTTATLYRGDHVLATAAEGGELIWKADAGQAAGPLVLKVTGDADSRGFVTWLQTGVPLKPPADETGKGLIVRRRLISPDDGKPIDTARLASGQLVRVELTVTAPADLDNVVVEDLLPAGLEIENPRLKTTARADDAPAHPKRPRPLKLNAAPDIRDDRIVLFANVRAGEQTYEYLARAITPGTFTVPPVRAECMYDLATFSLTGSGKMTVTADRTVPIAVTP